jgi:hypothetical protein
MKALNLPSAELTIKNEKDGLYVFDMIRKKYILLTPEEWVRQHVIHFLIQFKSYPKGLFKIEKYSTKSATAGRTDIEVWNNEGQALLLVECKAPEQNINAQTVLQAMAYNEHVKAKYIMLTNGLKHYVLGLNEASQKFEQLQDVPFYNEAYNSSTDKA